MNEWNLRVYGDFMAIELPKDLEERARAKVDAGECLVPAAEADIDEALVSTLTRWGNDKYERYLALIEEALEALAANPWSGPPKPAIHPQARIYLLGQTWASRTAPVRLRSC